MRTSRQEVAEEVKLEIFSLLPQLLADINTPEEAKDFLSTFLSEKELEVLSKRLTVMYWLYKGRKYHHIRDMLKVSSATIATAQDTINLPPMLHVFRILDANEWASRVTDRLRKFVGKS